MFAAPSAEERAEWRRRIGEGRDAHDEIAAGASCLSQVDLWRNGDGDVDVDAAVQPPPGTWLRIAAWNIERGREAAAAGAVLASVDADVVLLSEVDRGM